MMRLSDLENLVAELRAEAGEGTDPVVRMAQQPRYPFDYAVAGLVLVNKAEEAQASWDQATAEERQGHERPASDLVVFIAEGGDQQYLSVSADKVWSSSCY